MTDAGRGQGHVAEHRLVAVVVAVDGKGHHAGNLQRGIVRRPQGGHIESIFSEDAQNVGLRHGAVDLFQSAPAVFVDRGLGAGIIFRHPALHHRNQLRRLRRGCAARCVIGVRDVIWLQDSGIDVSRIPESARRVEPRRLLPGVARRGQSDAVAVIGGGKIGVQVHIIQQANAISGLSRLELLQIVLDHRNAAVRLPVRGIAPGRITGSPRAPARLDILLGIEVAPPPVDHRAADLGRRVGGLDGQRGADAVVGHLVIGEGQWMHVGVIGIPPGRLVIQVIDGDALAHTGSRVARAKLVCQIICPAARPGGARPGGIDR